MRRQNKYGLLFLLLMAALLLTACAGGVPIVCKNIRKSAAAGARSGGCSMEERKKGKCQVNRAAPR